MYIHIYIALLNLCCNLSWFTHSRLKRVGRLRLRLLMVEAPALIGDTILLFASSHTDVFAFQSLNLLCGGNSIPTVNPIPSQKAGESEICRKNRAETLIITHIMLNCKCTLIGRAFTNVIVRTRKSDALPCSCSDSKSIKT